MGYNRKTKALNKNLYPQKSDGRLGRRKVRKTMVPMSGSLLYNTARREVGRHQQEETRRWSQKSPNAHFGALWARRPELRRLAQTRAGLKGNVPLLITLQNKLMHDGRRGAAEKIFFRVLSELNRYSPQGDGSKLFYAAVERLKPTLITVTRRAGRNYYSVPVPLKGSRQYKLAFQWLLEAARKSRRATLHTSLAEEVVAVVSGRPSEALKKKEALYRSVVANRAYSHYRWV